MRSEGDPRCSPEWTEHAFSGINFPNFTLSLWSAICVDFLVVVLPTVHLHLPIY